MRPTVLRLITCVLLLCPVAGCGDDKAFVLGQQPSPIDPSPRTAAINGLEAAFRGTDGAGYAMLLDSAFAYTDLSDSAASRTYGREDKLLRLTGTRDGARHGLFDVYRHVDFGFVALHEGSEDDEDYLGHKEGLGIKQLAGPLSWRCY